MRIDWVGGPGKADVARPRRGTSGFALPDDPTTAAESVTEGIGAGPVLSALLEETRAQEADARRADQEAAGHGQAMLDALSDLQLAALGGPDNQALGRLAALAAGGRAAADPALREVLQGVAARAAVELARSE